jgi:phosphonate transport system ATP-binding protein
MCVIGDGAIEKTPMLELDGVSVTYPGDVHALKPTSLAFDAGRFTVLLGPSGAGKSTLLRCLNGLVAPTAGRTLADGLGDIAQGHALREHRRRTGMIFQQHQLIGRLSALRNVLIGRLAYHGSLRSLLPLPRADRLIALECLDRVGLLDRALDRVDTLSGGMQQRVGIARALAQRPRLILADEPVASLDPTTAAKVLALLHAICTADGITAIVSLHQVELGLSVADRLIGIARGAIVFDGAAASFTAANYQRIYEKAPPPAREPAARTTPLRSTILATGEV